jgi:N-dimethylarginine dimethylaminohydrolase
VKVTRVLMCRPTNFDVKYVINPHMKPYSVVQPQALWEWENLVATLRSLSIQVDVIDQPTGVPDMVFATDQGIVRGNKVLLANFRYKQRKKETPYYRQWFKDNGFEVYDLTRVFSFEGGDALFQKETLMVGTGFRASVGSCEEISELFDIDVIPLRLIDPNFYHLDMCFLPLSDDSAVYYPAAFSESSRTLLARLVPQLHEMTQEEAESYAANSFVSDNVVVIQSGNPKFRQRLEDLGYMVAEVDLSEFKKAGGGIHCLINTLERS